MQPRPGFARFHPLLEIAVLVAAVIALRWCERPEPRPPQPVPHLTHILPARDDGGCSNVPAPVPAHGIVDAEGRAWDLADIPGHTLRGLDLRNAEWAGVDLHGATFIGCDFRGCDLRSAQVDGVTFEQCRLQRASLTGATGQMQFFDCCLRGADSWDADLVRYLGEDNQHSLTGEYSWDDKGGWRPPAGYKTPTTAPAATSSTP